jgi:uncharacterized membrane protein
VRADLDHLPRRRIMARVDRVFLESRTHRKDGDMIAKRMLATAFCATTLLALSAGPAAAGEVKGPPGTVNNTNETGALLHANSACAASGLNDLDTSEGQTVSQVQTAADSWKYYGLPKGAPGKLGLCKGGTGQR